MSYDGFIHDFYLSDLKDEGLKHGFAAIREFKAAKLGWIDIKFWLTTGDK